MSKINRKFQEEIDYVPYTELCNDNLPTDEDYVLYAEMMKEIEIEEFYR